VTFLSENYSKGESDPTPEEIASCNLWDKAGDVKDASLKASPSLHGVVLDKKLFARAVKDKRKRKRCFKRLKWNLKLNLLN
jgi:DNA-directed RNA polymerase subunit beta